MLNNSLVEVTGNLAKVGGWSLTCNDAGSLRCSAGILELFELPLDTKLSLQQIGHYILPRYRSEVLSRLDKCLRLAESCEYEFEIQTAQGTHKWVHIGARQEQQDEGSERRLVATLRDITAQKQQVRQAWQISDRLLVTLENMSDAFYLMDPDWRLLYMNKSAVKLLGREERETTGFVLWDEYTYLLDTPIYAGFHRAVRSKTPFHHEYFSELMDNWIELDAFPSPEGLAVYFHSITERKRMQERLDQAQHMESIGKLTGHVAHDFNNLLTIILGNAELLQDQHRDDEASQRLAEAIRTAALKGSDLTRRLLAYARKQQLEPKPMDINQLVDGMRELLVRTLGVNINVVMLVQPNLPSALVDEHQLEGALLNLSLNARDAMPKGGELTITTRDVWVQPEEASQYSDFRPGHYVRIRVADTGTGISPDHLKHVFEPFFTTKELGKGTGLGLSSVFGFAKQSHGHVTIDSQAGVGTRVSLYLPVTTEPVLTISDKQMFAHGGKETILIVDDDEMVRNAAQTVLASKLGYDVLAVSNGETALSVLKNKREIHLLFTDVMMPGINGHELAHQARQLRPDLKILLTSGYVSPELAVPNPADSDFPLLAKPYTQRELARMLREILDGAD